MYSLNQTKDLSIYDGKRSIPAAFTVFSDTELRNRTKSRGGSVLDRRECLGSSDPNLPGEGERAAPAVGPAHVGLARHKHLALEAITIRSQSMGVSQSGAIQLSRTRAGSIPGRGRRSPGGRPSPSLSARQRAQRCCFFFLLNRSDLDVIVNWKPQLDGI
jgi:hypothetical protein